MIVIRLASGYVSFSICNSIANAQISSHTTALGNAYECGVFFLFCFRFFPTNMTVVSTCLYYALRKMCKSLEFQILGICRLGFNMFFHLVYSIIDGVILHLLMSIHHISDGPRLFSNQACLKKAQWFSTSLNNLSLTNIIM